MVDAFSQYARTPDFELSSVNINNVISEVADMYHPQESWLEIELSLDPSLPPIEADAGRIRQVLHNLFRNAVEAMEGSEGAKVEVETDATVVEGQSMVRIRVTDNGPGFAGDIVHRVFEPYVTSKLKGTGLGLAIVKKIVEEHGGRLSIANTATGGAEISILLPVSGGSTMLSSRAEQRRERA